MYLRVREVGIGMHPDERIVEVLTKSGREEFPVFPIHRHGEFVEIGYPVGGDAEYYLVQLPAETGRGAWRIWVRRSDVVDEDKLRVPA